MGGERWVRIDRPKATASPQRIRRHPGHAHVMGGAGEEMALQVLQRARFTPGALTPADVLALQSAVGNAAVNELLSRSQRPATAATPAVQRVILDPPGHDGHDGTGPPTAPLIEPEHLPALLGSPAQVAWAEQVRAEKIAEMERYVETLVAASAQDLSPEDLAELRHAALQRFAPLLARTSAVYWINLMPAAGYSLEAGSQS